jgi:hypothetical protein
MKIEQLYKKLTENNISSDKYYLHGLFGSSDDNERLGLKIFKDGNRIKCQIYFKERGQVTSSWDYDSEDEACEVMFQELKDEQTFWEIRKIEGLDGMTVNERLYASGLMDEFDRSKRKDKNRAKQILRWLRVDQPSIDKIIN